MKGKIVRLVKDKRFGFLNAGEKNDIFFHQSALKNVKFDDLTVGQEVEFELGEGAKGPRAEEIYV